MPGSGGPRIDRCKKFRPGRRPNSFANSAARAAREGGAGSSAPGPSCNSGRRIAGDSCGGLPLMVLRGIDQPPRPPQAIGRMMIQPAGSHAGPVLVTGASGFIGSAIVQAFGRAGYPVRALVRRSSVRANLIDTDCEV